MDRFADSTSHLSPYNYAWNNPLINIDINGDSVIVLSAPSGASRFGHAAVLIGNNANGWQLYSKNGTEVNKGVKGPNTFGDENGTYYPSLEVFAAKGNKNHDTGEVYYEEAYLIPTNSDTDQKMIKGAQGVLEVEYNLTESSCIDVCSDALKSGGLDPGTSTFNYSNIGVQTTSFKYLDNIPRVRFNAIKANNKGVDVTQSILPKK